MYQPGAQPQIGWQKEDKGRRPNIYLPEAQPQVGWHKENKG